MVTVTFSYKNLSLSSQVAKLHALLQPLIFGPCFGDHCRPTGSTAIAIITNAHVHVWCSSTAGCYQHRYEWREGSMVLWYSSASINIDVNGMVCGAPVQFGCYQHRHKWMCWSPIHIRLSLELSCTCMCTRSTNQGVLWSAWQTRVRPPASSRTWGGHLDWQ